MARVRLGVYAGLRQYVANASTVDVEISPEQTVAQVLQKLGIPPEKAHIVFVNNRAADINYPLQGGEQVSVFPAVGGG